MTQSEQINELAAALAKAQGAMSNASKNRVNPHFKSQYADLAAVLDAIRAPLAANGLSFTQTMGFNEHGHFLLRTMLLHSSGQFITTEYPLPSTGTPQQMGASQTYARRYSLAAIVGVAQDDDDGNTAIEHKPEHKPEAKPTPRISPQDLKDVQVMIEETGTDTAKLCRHFKIGSLMEITPALLQEIKIALNAKPKIVPVPDAAE